MKKLPVEREKSYHLLGIAVAKQVFSEFKKAYTRYLKTGNTVYKMNYGGRVFNGDINTLIRYILSDDFSFFIGESIDPKTALIITCKEIERNVKCKKEAKMLSTILTEDLS